jgi:hypothetical protein
LNKQSNSFEDKLDEVMIEMFKAKANSPVQSPVQNYQQYPYNPMNQSRSMHLARGRLKSTIDSRLSGVSRYSNMMPRTKNRIRRLLRKVIFVVAFPILLRSEAQKLARKRKSILKTFYL